MTWWVEFSEILRNLGIVLAGGLGIWIAWNRTRAATRQADAALNAHLQEVFANAVSNLASQDLPVRIGGIVALKELAASHPRFKPQVLSIFAGFVRSSRGEQGATALAPDIQEVLSYLSEEIEEP